MKGGAQIPSQAANSCIQFIGSVTGQQFINSYLAQRLLLFEADLFLGCVLLIVAGGGDKLTKKGDKVVRGGIL